MRPSEINGCARVLLVEDDATVAAGIADLLATYGFAVRIVHTGGEALRAVETFVPDVVVLDVHLPDIGGDNVFRGLRSRCPSLPVVFSSGHVRELDDVVDGNPSRVALLQKPYSGEQLVEAIARVRR